MIKGVSTSANQSPNNWLKFFVFWCPKAKSDLDDEFMCPSIPKNQNTHLLLTL